MSEWFEIKDPEDVELSDDGKAVQVMFDTDNNGNRYVEIPVEMLVKLLADRLEIPAYLKEVYCQLCGEPLSTHVVSEHGGHCKR